MFVVIFVLVAAVLAVLGLGKQHVREFVPFQFAVLALAVIIVAVIMVVYKPGERATREPLEDE